MYDDIETNDLLKCIERMSKAYDRTGMLEYKLRSSYFIDEYERRVSNCKIRVIDNKPVIFGVLK